MYPVVKIIKIISVCDFLAVCWTSVFGFIGANKQLAARRSQLKEWTAESRQSALTALMAKRCGQKLAAGVFSVSESGGGGGRVRTRGKSEN